MSSLIPAAIELPALHATGDTPAARRRWLAQQSDSALASMLLSQMTATRDQATATFEWASLADAANAPHTEVFASPFGLRAVALAASEGAALVHHERRVCQQWPDEYQPDDAVAEGEHGEWVRGNLHTAKYQGFLQDDPLSAFQPHHMAKWTPHELLHRAAAFFWRADATRWELYVGARLNELVPVVLWYGLDEIGRREGTGFVRSDWAARPAATRDDATWLFCNVDRLAGLAASGVPLLRASVAHFERELAAIDEELRTSRRVRVVDPVLDSSSDATAYVVGHAARLNDRAVSRCFDRLLRPGVDYFCDVFEYRDAIETLFDRLLFETIHFDAQRAIIRRDSRVVRDWLQRAAHLGWNSFRRVVPLLPDAARDIERAYNGKRLSPVEWRRRIAAALEPEHAAIVLHNGAIVDEQLGLPPETHTTPPDISQLLEGLRSIVPRATDLATQRDPNFVARFADSPSLWQRAPLSQRFKHFVAENESDSSISDLIDLEVAIAQADVRIDEELETLALSHETFDATADIAMLRLSDAFEFVALNPDAFVQHAELEAAFDWPPSVFLIGGYRGGVSLLPLWPAQHQTLLALRAEPMLSDDFLELLRRAMQTHGTAPPELAQDAGEWLAELVAAGAIAAMPYLERNNDE